MIKEIDEGMHKNILLKDPKFVTEEVDCPRCRNAACWHGNHGTFEQFLICFDCGYQSHFKIIKTRRGTYKILYKEHRAAGVYNIGFMNGEGHGASLPDPNKENVDWEEIISWFRTLMKGPGVDQDQCYLGKYDEKEKKIIPVIGSPVW